MLDNLKKWALGQSKRLAAAAALLVTLAASQPAWALRWACVSKRFVHVAPPITASCGQTTGATPGL